jgi:signal transduction histidine kinase
MKEDTDMMRIARAEMDPDATPELAPPEQSTLPTEVLARLDRLATASVLASGLAHEIASPLSALLGALDGLERRIRDVRRTGAASDLDELAVDLELATVSSTAITDLVHDFQLFLRQEPPRATLASPREAVQRALRLVSQRLGVIARVEVELRDVPMVRAPLGRIVQVVLNLLMNACEALAYRDKALNLLAVRTDTAAGRVLIEVWDNGPGLSAAVRGRLFEPGVSYKPSRTSTGLGLAISRELVQKMGGEISVSSLPGAGTTFLVSLPVA